MPDNENEPDDMEIEDAEENSELASGTIVELTGLRGAAHLNGKIGRVKDYLTEKDRYRVELIGGWKAIRPANLKVLENQKVEGLKFVNNLNQEWNKKMQQKTNAWQYEQQQKQAMWTMGGMFTLMVIFMLVQTGALSWLYNDSFAAPYLQKVGKPIYDNVLLPTYEKALIPLYENVIVPLNTHVVTPVREVLKQISTAIADYVFRPIREKALIPLYENVLVPVKDQVSGVLKDTLPFLFGSGDSASTETTGEAESTPLVDEIEHTEL